MRAASHAGSWYSDNRMQQILSITIYSIGIECAIGGILESSHIKYQSNKYQGTNRTVRIQIGCSFNLLVTLDIRIVAKQLHLPTSHWFN